jgi:hypothetical protein
MLQAGSRIAMAVCNRTITSLDATGTVGVPFTYTITVSGGNPQSYGAANLPPGLSVTDPINGVISGTPTAAGTYSVTLSAVINSGQCTTIFQNRTFTINAPLFAGFRLPDFQTPAGVGYTPRLMLQVGANGGVTTSNRFNATLEVDASGGLGTAWVPYNRFVGINDLTSWITDAPLPVRNSSGSTGVPQAFGSLQLTQSPPGVYMKADPRATRFGIFQMDTNPTSTSRILDSIWPTGSATLQNGYGGTVATTFPGPVEHSPNRWPAGTAYYPATLSINGSPDARDTATMTYADNDSVTRAADAIYPDPTANLQGTGSWTPYYGATSYRPIVLNRPLQNVAELGYAFRDLPWKTLDFFTDKSADAGLLDIFTINDGPALFDANGNFTGMGALPTTVAGSVNLNTTQPADLQSIFAGAILDDNPTTPTTVNPTNTGLATDAPALASQVVSATATTPMLNKSELITRTNLPTTILPTPTPTTTVQTDRVVKARREVVARTISSVAQTRTWNFVIDVVAQSGHFKPNAGNLQNDFIVEGEQHYWVHVAIDRFTGKVIDKQIEVVNE